MRIPRRHVPTLLVASSMAFGGLIPLWDAAYAIRLFGLPAHVSTSAPAQSVMVVASARTSALGLALFTFYAQRKYREVDTVLVILSYLGLVDAYVCCVEGVRGKAAFRALSALAVAAWGWAGMTAG